MIERTMIDLNKKRINTIDSRSMCSQSTTAAVKQPRSPHPQERTCMASTVTPPGGGSLRKLVSGITLLKQVSSFGSSSSSLRSFSQDTECPVAGATESNISTTRQRGDSAAMLLHDLCQKGHPKLEEVVRVAKAHPKSLEEKNDEGQYPLHVAVANAIMPEVIMFMVLKFPHACAVADVHGKLPLHYAASVSGWTVKNNSIFEADSTGEIHPVYNEMINLLCKVHGAALVQEDESGCNPIEYALLDDAPRDIVRNLQRESVKYQRAKRAMLIARSRKVPSEINVLAGKCA